MKQPKDPLQLPKPTRNTRKITIKLMTVASGEINLERKNNLFCHIVKVKAAKSAHSMADVIPFLVYSIFSSNPTLRYNEKKTLYTIKKTISVTFSVH